MHLAAFVSSLFAIFLCYFGQVTNFSVDWRENQFVEVGLAIMGDRKSRSVTFKGIFNISVGAMKTARNNCVSKFGK